MANLLSKGDKDKRWIELLRGLLPLKLRTAGATPARPSKGYDSKTVDKRVVAQLQALADLYGVKGSVEPYERPRTAAQLTAALKL